MRNYIWMTAIMTKAIFGNLIECFVYLKPKTWTDLKNYSLGSREENVIKSAWSMVYQTVFLPWLISQSFCCIQIVMSVRLIFSCKPVIYHFPSFEFMITFNIMFWLVHLHWKETGHTPGVYRMSSMVIVFLMVVWRQKISLAFMESFCLLEKECVLASGMLYC